MERRDVQALPPPFTPGAPQFAPHASPGDRGDPEPAFSALGPVNPLVRWCFRLRRGRLRAHLVAFLEESWHVGAEKLIKIATGQRRRRLRHEAAAAAARCSIALLSRRPSVSLLSESPSPLFTRVLAGRL
jgi:hypothetical protein